jgi:hypothetical protein
LLFVPSACLLGLGSVGESRPIDSTGAALNFQRSSNPIYNQYNHIGMEYQPNMAIFRKFFSARKT